MRARMLCGAGWPAGRDAVVAEAPGKLTTTRDLNAFRGRGLLDRGIVYRSSSWHAFITLAWISVGDLRSSDCPGRSGRFAGRDRRILDQKTELTSAHQYRLPIRGCWLISKSGKCIVGGGCEAKYPNCIKIPSYIEITQLYRNSVLFRYFTGISK
jgi:hypothetical protein